MLANILSRYWWMILLRGILSIVLSVVIFSSPGFSLASFIIVFGVFTFVDGIGNAINAIGGRGEHEHWGVILLSGLAGIVLGLLMFKNPGATAVVILTYIAIWAIVTGLLQIVAAIRLRKEIEGEFWMMLGGLASVLVGLFLLGNPGTGALTIMYLIAGYALAFGLVLIVLAFKARGFAKRLKAAVHA